MASGCDEFNRFERVLSAASWAGPEQRAFEQHAARCASCQAQWVAHAELLQSGPGMEMPALPEDFNSRLHHRLKSESLAPVPQPGATRWLHGYWVVAALLSLYIVVRTDWPAPLDSPWIPALFVSDDPGGGGRRVCSRPQGKKSGCGLGFRRQESGQNQPPGRDASKPRVRPRNSWPGSLQLQFPRPSQRSARFPKNNRRHQQQEKSGDGIDGRGSRGDETLIHHDP